MKMTKHRVTTRSYQNWRKKLEYSLNFPKNRQYCSKIPIPWIRRFPLKTLTICRLSAPNYQKQPNFAQKSVKSVSNSTNIAQNTVKYCRNPCFSRQNDTICVRRSTNPEFDEKWRIRRKTATPTTTKSAEKSEKKNPEKKKNFSFIIFLFTI